MGEFKESNYKMEFVSTRKYKNVSVVLVVLFLFCLASLFLRSDEIERIRDSSKKDLPLTSSRLGAFDGVDETGHLSREVPQEDAEPIETIPNIVFPLYNNVMPNPYVAGSTDLTGYQNSILTFLHNPKSGGTTLKECLISLSRFLRKDRPLLVTPATREETQTGFMNGVIRPEDNDFMMGGASLGVCESFSSRRCSYFTIVREPYDRVISHYFFCKNGGESSISCENKTIEDFAVEAGSIFFSQLAMTVDCKCEGNCDDSSGRPWRCSNDYVSYNRNMRYKEELLRYLEKRMETYFAVIGLTEEYQETLKLLQQTFGIPFYDQCHETRRNAGTYGTDDKKELDEKKAQALKEILASERVKETLYPDVVLYERAVEIYRIQKSKLSLR